MLLDLAERLRCPAAHAPTPLVVVARAKRDRDLREGFAGCPVCRLEARFVEGNLYFGEATPARAEPRDPARLRAISPRAVEAPPPDLERVLALLALSEPGGAVLLTGRYALLAESIAGLVDVAVVVMGAVPSAVASERVTTVLGLSAPAPFADSSFRAAALDAASPPDLLEDAVRTVVTGGRVLAAASLPVPVGLRELARDAVEWVAERETPLAPIALRRR